MQIEIGEKNAEENLINTDIYIFNFTRYPGFRKFEITVNGLPVKFTPEVNAENGPWLFYQEEAVVFNVITDEPTIKISRSNCWGGTDKNENCGIEVKFGYTTCKTNTTLTLADYPINADGVRDIKFNIVGIGSLNADLNIEYILHIVPPVYDYVPKITEQSATQIIRNKAETTTIYVKADNSEDAKNANGVLTYQWQESIANKSVDIEDATNPEYVVAAVNEAGELVYRCVILNSLPIGCQSTSKVISLTKLNHKPFSQFSLSLTSWRIAAKSSAVFIR